jgi:hypothetical protein
MLWLGNDESGLASRLIDMLTSAPRFFFFFFFFLLAISNDAKPSRRLIVVAFYCLSLPTNSRYSACGSSLIPLAKQYIDGIAAILQLPLCLHIRPV